jgi:hypothetical protein
MFLWDKHQSCLGRFRLIAIKQVKKLKMLVRFLATTAVVLISGCSRQKTTDDRSEFPLIRPDGAASVEDPSTVPPNNIQVDTFSETSNSREGSTDTESISSSDGSAETVPLIHNHSGKVPHSKGTGPMLAAGSGAMPTRRKTGHTSFTKSYSSIPKYARKLRKPSSPREPREVAEEQVSGDDMSGFRLGFHEEDVRSEISWSDASEETLPFDSESIESERYPGHHHSEFEEESLSQINYVNEGDMELESIQSEKTRKVPAESSMKQFATQQAGVAAVEKLIDQLNTRPDDFVSISRKIAELIPYLARTTAVGRALEDLGDYWFTTAQQYLSHHPESVGAIEAVFLKIKDRSLLEEQEVDFQNRIDAIKVTSVRTPGKLP